MRWMGRSSLRRFLVALALVGCTSFGTSPDGPDGSASPTRTDLPALCEEGCPVGAWSFDEEEGRDLLDGSGNGNTGGLMGATRTSGKTGNALSFSEDATSPQALVPNSRSLDVSGTSLTVTFWVWITPTTKPGDQVLFGKPWTEGPMAPPYYQFGVEWSSGNAKTIDLLLGDAATMDYRKASVAILDSRWVHVAFVFDGRATTPYVDGAPAATLETPTTLSARGTALRFGVDGAGAQSFGGKLDDVRVYARALSPTTIARIAGK